MKQCLFCSSQLRKENRAKEHVIPLWILRRLDATGEIVYGRNWTYPNEPMKIIDERQQIARSRVFGDICKSCNCGWMSVLEADVTPLIEALWEVETPTILTNEQCHTLARWFFKTACIMNYSANYKKIIPRLHVKEFYKFQQLPGNSYVDIAYCGMGKGEYNWVQGGNKQFIIHQDTSFSSREQEQSYVITLQINRFMLRLAWTPRNDVRPSLISQEAVTRIFPNDLKQQLIQPGRGGIFRDHNQFHFTSTIFMDEFSLSEIEKPT